jgi:hypothetical protein
MGFPMQWLLILKAVVLITIANGSPIIARELFARYFNQPVDQDVVFVDGRPVLGRSKTIRGIMLSIIVATATAPILRLKWTSGLVVGSAAMSGDLLSSFLKRRLSLPTE